MLVRKCEHSLSAFEQMLLGCFFVFFFLGEDSLEYDDTAPSRQNEDLAVNTKHDFNKTVVDFTLKIYQTTFTGACLDLQYPTGRVGVKECCSAKYVLACCTA